MSEKLNLKVGDRVRLTGEDWTNDTSYPLVKTGDIVVVAYVDERGGAWNPDTESLTREDGTSFVGGYGVEKVEDTTPGGVWAVIDRDHGESITSVYPTEIKALRVLNGRGYGRVAFLAYGEALG